MRVLPLVISLLVTIALVFALNTQWGSIPPIGKLLSPQHGFWQNAESVKNDFNDNLSFPQLKGKTDVYFDERLVPHVFAQHEEDLYFIQGYLHAKFRLWQMEFQTFAAAGRVSEVLGAGADNRYLNYDRRMRRLGMIYAAEKSLEAAQKNPASKMQYDSYAAGVNAYIDDLTPAHYPIEYKLLNYKPEKWTPLKTALFLKYMSYDLAGKDDDFEYTNARTAFTKNEFEKLYPIAPDSLKPIVPKTVESPYPSKSIVDLTVPLIADSLYFTYKADSFNNVNPDQPDKDNGSNNWAVAGSRTASGRPIICNDPHLGLNLPSLWYEMQLSTPEFTAYGVSFPGSPNIIIGFNNDIAWAVTNAGRDVKDYYELEVKDDNASEYKFNGEWIKTTSRPEVIKIKGTADLIDTVRYTEMGPIIYDARFPVDSAHTKFLAVRWKAHDPSNEGYTFYGLNHAKNYEDYLESIKHFTCPAQNFLFASKSGDIAIWQQGEFPAKWRRQGDFVMPGTDSGFLWKAMIPQGENPHLKNPTWGYASSANQLSADSSYPYYSGNYFPVYRGYIINRRLSEMNNITADDMKALQTDNYNVKAEFSKDILMQIDRSQLSPDEMQYFNIYAGWDLRNDPNSRGATVFNVWWDELSSAIYDDEFARSKLELPGINESTLVEALHKDSNYLFTDNINTPEKETLATQLVASLKKAVARLTTFEKEGRLEWGKFKDTRVDHLLKQVPFSRLHLPIGGGSGIINATKENHGPSWRMVVQLTDETEAYGVYPGGQSGNPGSKYYDMFVDNWAAGKYYNLWVMKAEQKGDKRIIAKMTFTKG